MVPVLMYHSIGGKASYLTVSRKLFAEQMRALKVAGFHTLTIEQYAHFVKHGYRGLPSRPILLTFDDGREDAYRAANDLLEAYGFHVTELVVPAWVTGHPHFSLSWSQLQQMAQTSTWRRPAALRLWQGADPLEPGGRHRGRLRLPAVLPGPERRARP